MGKASASLAKATPLLMEFEVRCLSQWSVMIGHRGGRAGLFLGARSSGQDVGSAPGGEHCISR